MSITSKRAGKRRKVAQTVLGRLLSKRRNDLDHSFADAGRKLGSSPQTVSNWERGLCPLREKLPAIAEYLNVTLDEASRLRLRVRR